MMVNMLEKGLEHHRQGLLDEAEAVYRAILARDGENPDALHMLGVLLSQKGSIDEGIRHMTRALQINPTVPAYHCNLANALHDTGRYEEALKESIEALTLRPDYAEAHFIKGLSLSRLGRRDEAIECYQQAVHSMPGMARAYNNLGILLVDRGDLRQAHDCYAKALDINPAYAEAYNNLGNLFKSTGKPSQALVCFEKAISLRPDYADCHTNLGGTYKDLGMIDEALAFDRKAVYLDPDNPIFISNYVLTLHYRDGISREELFRAHLEWAARYARPRADADFTHTNTTDPEKRLRIGYISGDLKTHSVAYFFEPIIDTHNRTEFEIFCYADVPVPDEVSARFKALSDTWRDISHLSAEQAAQIIRNDRIDILVDLAGHTNTRIMEVCAMKPAPVQVTYLGYPNTTGLPTMDYRLTDAHADPVGDSERYHTERLVRLPDSFLCYRPPSDTPEVRDLPAISRGEVTFGSFNNRSKMTQTAIETWAAILRTVPSSRIILKATMLGDDKVRHTVSRQFTRAGIGEDRVIIHAYLPSKFEHFALYNEIDLCLDTFPYNGTTTTCEALWMGVPVMVLQGSTHVSRVGFSIMHCLGLDDMVASTREDYIARAVSLANDLPRLVELRAGLRQRLKDSPIMDASRFTRRLEAEYRTMWKAWCASGGKETGIGEERPSLQAARLIDEGEVLFQSGRYAEAGTIFREALRIDPRNVDALNDLGVVLWKNGDAEKAIDCFEEALRIDPANEDAHANLEGINKNS